MKSIRQTLLDIEKTGFFEQLEPLKTPVVWSQMTVEDRDLFVLLLLRQGAHFLSKGDLAVLDSFKIAKEAAIDAASVLYQQGVMFASYPTNSRCLLLASQSFAESTQNNPASFDSWYQWGNVCVIQGLLHGDVHYFAEGDEKFRQASEHVSTRTQDVSMEQFYWNWGRCVAALGRCSGEPVDLYRALNLYQTAQNLDCKEAQFFDDYGRVLVDLASLLERQEMFLEASKYFDLALEKDPLSSEACYHKACCFFSLNLMTMQEEYFEYAMIAFERAVQLNPVDARCWMKWGQLESLTGKRRHHRHLLESSLEKYAKAYELDPDYSEILNSWAEVELFLGASQERLDLIQSAKNRIIKHLELHPENEASWYIYGSCLNELGHYFEEEDFYYKAIEKFNYGLSLSSEYPLLWYGLALSNLSLGEMHEDISFLEKAVRYCSNVLECGKGEVASQFWNDWGVALMKLAELSDEQDYVEMAIDKFEKAFKKPLESTFEDVNLDWVYNYGCAFDLLGDLSEDPTHFEKAINILTQVVQLDPSHVPARYGLALALSHLGEVICDVEYYYKAISHFQFLLEQDPEDEMIYTDSGICLINLALLIQDIHQPEQTQQLYRQAESLLMHAASLGSCQAFYQLAGLYSLTSQYALAMHYIERAQFFGALPSTDELMNDDWLEGLRNTQAFRAFLSQLSSQSTDEK